MFISTDANKKEETSSAKSNSEEIHDQDKNLRKKQPLEVNLVKITDGIIKGDPYAKEELKHHIKMLKTEINRNSSSKSLSFDLEMKDIEKGISELVLKTEGTEDLILHIGKIFEGNSWAEDLENRIKKELAPIINDLSSNKHLSLKTLKTARSDLMEQQESLDILRNKLSVKTEVLQESLKAEQLKTIVLALKDAGSTAIEEQSYDKAITILADTNKKILPLVTSSLELSTDELTKLTNSVLIELETALVGKGRIGEAIKVIDSQYLVPRYRNEEYRKSQLKKSSLLVQSGEFKQAVNLLKGLLGNCCEEEIEYNTSAEIKRALGMAYRGQGSYDKSLKYFQESQEEFLIAKSRDPMDSRSTGGYNKAIWGEGVLHYLRGEWEEALAIWKQLEEYYSSEKPKMLFKIYYEFMRTFKLSGKYKKAEEMLDKALEIISSDSETENSKAKVFIYLGYAEIYFLQNKLSHAVKYIETVRSLSKNQDKAFQELNILEIEVEILCSQDKSGEAREKLEVIRPECTSNWDKVKFYRLLARIEKYEMNYGAAQTALKSAIEITKEIGAITYSDELALTELLIEMSRIGNAKAYSQAKERIAKIDLEISEKSLPALQLESKLQHGYLAWSQSDFESAYRIFAEIIQESEIHRLFRQKTKAIDALNTIENQEQHLSVTTKSKAVYRYLDDARRILKESS
ncbi:MAG: tetratricopeptide repeat protein [Candidatus Hodarchaeales archaeon]